MGTVFEFPHAPSPLVQIPKPVNYDGSANYLVMEFDSPGQAIPVSFYPETKMIFRLGQFVNGVCHAIATPKGTALSRLKELEDGRIEAYSVMEGSPNGVFKKGELAVLGYLEEIYPLGWKGGHWMYVPEKAVSIPLPLPVYRVR